MSISKTLAVESVLRTLKIIEECDKSSMSKEELKEFIIDTFTERTLLFTRKRCEYQKIICSREFYQSHEKEKILTTQNATEI